MNRIFFAGEATTKYYPGLVNGAYITGLREVNRIKLMENQLPSLRVQLNTPPAILSGMEDSVKNWEVYPDHVFCKEDKVLLIGGNPEDGFRPACLSSSAADKLIERGWPHSLEH